MTDTHFDHPSWNIIAEYTQDVAAQVQGRRKFNGLPYAAISLTNREADVIDTSELEEYDPLILASVDLMAFDWGDNGHPFDKERKLEILLIGDTPESEPDTDVIQEEEVRLALRLILGARIGAAALAHISQDPADMTALCTMLEDSRINIARLAYPDLGSPLAMLQAGKIVRCTRGNSKDGKLLLGSRAATLWYPPWGDPHEVLAALQRAVGGSAAPSDPTLARGN